MIFYATRKFLKSAAIGLYHAIHCVRGLMSEVLKLGEKNVPYHHYSFHLKVLVTTYQIDFAPH